MHVWLTLILWENVLTFSIFLQNTQEADALFPALTRALRCSVRDWFLLLSRIFSMNQFVYKINLRDSITIWTELIRIGS